MVGLPWTPLGYPVVALCHGDPAGLGLQDRSLHVLQKIINWVDVGAGQLITLFLSLCGCRVDQLTSSTLLSPPG